MTKLFMIFKQIFKIVKDCFSGKFELNAPISTINNSPINITNGNFVQASTVVKLDSKEAVTEFANQVTRFLHDKCMVDVKDDKFIYYINHSIQILKLNDSQTKRTVLRELLYKKFDGSEQGIDDSDAPTTIALEAMRYMTDNMLKHLCSYRLMINVIPSELNKGRVKEADQLIDSVNDYGLMTQDEVMNMRRLGIINDMPDKIYSISDVLDNKALSGKLKHLDLLSDHSLLSSKLTCAGIIITDVLLDRFLGISGSYEHWLPVNNRSLHVNDLVVDKDARVNQNMIVQGDTSSGGRGDNVMS